MSHRHDETISVVMPVHNALPYLDEAVRSILDQTYPHFEFVIFDDGSTDGSLERLREWADEDERIRLFESDRNLGPVASSNRVVEHARGRIIARMDADDISHPERLERQLRVLRQDSRVGLVGSLCDAVSADGRPIRGPDTWRLIRKSWFTPFPHGSIMFRREVFDRAGGYRAECEFWEDQDLFVRMLTRAEATIVTLRESLYKHRHSRISTRLVSDQERMEQSLDLMFRCMARLDASRDYDDVLRNRTAGAPSRVNPRVFISIGSLDLWSHGRPRLFRRLLRHGRLSADFSTASALVWTAWASSSPATLRAFMKALSRLRNGVAWGRGIPEAVEWAPPCEPAAVVRSGQAREPRPGPAHL